MNAVYTATVAGPHAAKFAASAEMPVVNDAQIEALTADMYAPLERFEGLSTSEIEWRVKSLMQFVPYTNYKSEERLLEAMKEVEKLKADVEQIVATDWHDLAKAHACRAMVLCTEMFFRGSIARKETRGWHIREDYPQRNDQDMLHWIDFQKSEDGSMIMSTENLPMENYKYKPESF